MGFSAHGRTEKLSRLFVRSVPEWGAIGSPRIRRCKNKTYSSRDSHVVTHRSTNLPFNCLCMAERTGCPVFS
ncbi:hypothetical protein KCU92_g9427, partial [Aureobasidium melanogenum]